MRYNFFDDPLNIDSAAQQKGIEISVITGNEHYLHLRLDTY